MIFAEKRSIKRIACFAAWVLLLCALTAYAVSAHAAGEYRALKTGCYGDDVLALKQRLYDLGYFNSSTFNNRYTEDTAARVQAFEKACGLPETGAATCALQTLLFSEDAVSKKAGSAGNEITLPDIENAAYRDLSTDSSGDDVLRLKEKLRQLGYFGAKAETAVYNRALEDAVRACQRDHGMDATGSADAAFQQRLFEGTLKASALPTSAPQITPSPGAVPGLESIYFSVPTQAPANPGAPTSTPVGPAKAITLPELTNEGFLADQDAIPFVYADRNDGQWYYISQDLSIKIVRMQNKRQKITWFETEVRCTESSMPRSFLAQGSREDGHNYLTPIKIGQQYNVILGISDDFYGYRWYNKLHQGVIVRNGEIKADDPLPADSQKWPYLEILALFKDGSMRVYESDEHTAQEYIAMGVTDTFAFGPILVRNGDIDQSLYDKKVVRYTDDEPRMALGCIAPYHYIIVTAKGRTSDSTGVPMHWLAERMKALGCQNALNLDGGNTVALYFMGDVINKVCNSTSFRDISSMFGFSAQ